VFNSIDIVPSSLRDDPQVQAICFAIDKELQEIYDGIPSVNFIPNIKRLTGSLLDILGWQFHVDVWAGWEGNLDDATKQQLILESIEWHAKKGTKWAVNQVLKTVFKQGVVTEWYEYGGRPYFFKITTYDDIVDPVKQQQVIDAVYALKNERSWLDPAGGFIRYRQQQQTLYATAVATQQISTRIRMSK
jgi:phage tail P2-like protein